MDSISYFSINVNHFAFDTVEEKIETHGAPSLRKVPHDAFILADKKELLQMHQRKSATAFFIQIKITKAMDRATNTIEPITVNLNRSLSFLAPPDLPK